MLHAITKNPLFDIDEDEADLIVKRAANVARHYDNIPGVAPKTKDWIMFIQAMGSMYIPRLIAWRMDVNSRRPAPPPPRHPSAPANIVASPMAPKPVVQAVSDLPRNQPMPSVNDRSSFPQETVKPNGSQPPAAPRHQPGLEGLDGANLTLKLQ